jgi:hypothetical protein
MVAVCSNAETALLALLAPVAIDQYPGAALCTEL